MEHPYAVVEFQIRDDNMKPNFFLFFFSLPLLKEWEQNGHNVPFLKSASLR